MECKSSEPNRPTQLTVLVLIGTLWNVNICPCRTLYRDTQVLIGTLWNVNTACIAVDNSVKVVLIGTLWNVNNSILQEILGGVVRFNRYIVECKSDFKRLMMSALTVLIGTLWNVNP